MSDLGDYDYRPDPAPMCSTCGAPAVGQVMINIGPDFPPYWFRWCVAVACRLEAESETRWAKRRRDDIAADPILAAALIPKKKGE